MLKQSGVDLNRAGGGWAGLKQVFCLERKWARNAARPNGLNMLGVLSFGYNARFSCAEGVKTNLYFFGGGK